MTTSVATKAMLEEIDRQAREAAPSPETAPAVARAAVAVEQASLQQLDDLVTHLLNRWERAASPPEPA